MNKFGVIVGLVLASSAAARADVTWMTASEFEAATGKQFATVTSTRDQGEWAGELVAVEVEDAGGKPQWTGRGRVQVTWTSDRTSHQCFQIHPVDRRELEDFRGPSQNLQRCDGSPGGRRPGGAAPPSAGRGLAGADAPEPLPPGVGDLQVLQQMFGQGMGMDQAFNPEQFSRPEELVELIEPLMNLMTRTIETCETRVARDPHLDQAAFRQAEDLYRQGLASYQGGDCAQAITQLAEAHRLYQDMAYQFGQIRALSIKMTCDLKTSDLMAFLVDALVWLPLAQGLQEGGPCGAGTFSGSTR